MGKLSAEMRRLMEMKNFSPHTVSSYLLQMKLFFEHSKLRPEELNEDSIMSYLYYMRKKKNSSTSTIQVAYSAIKFFMNFVLDKQIDFKRIPFPKKDKKLPVVLSAEEVKTILNIINNPKHKSIVMTAYATGLRLSEIRHLKVLDIDSKRMQIHVRQGKGKKDRFALLSPCLLKQLRMYYKICKPAIWLFPGKDDDQPICSMSVQRMFNNTKKKPASIKRSAFTPCVTVSPPISWNPALTW